MLIRFAMRSARLRHFIKGESVFLVKDGAINFKNFKRNSLEMEQFRLLLRQKGIFSMFDAEDVIFETNGAVTVLPPNHTAPSFLLVNNGAIIESTLDQCNLTREEALHNETLSQDFIQHVKTGKKLTWHNARRLSRLQFFWNVVMMDYRKNNTCYIFCTFIGTISVIFIILSLY